MTLTLYSVEEAQGEEEDGEPGEKHPGSWYVLSETRGETEHTWSGHKKSPNTTEVVTWGGGRELSPAVYSQYSQASQPARSPNNVHNTTQHWEKLHGYTEHYGPTRGSG